VNRLFDLRTLERYGWIAVIAAVVGCLLAASLHDVPLVLPIVIGCASGLLVRRLPWLLRWLRARFDSPRDASGQGPRM